MDENSKIVGRIFKKILWFFFAWLAIGLVTPDQLHAQQLSHARESIRAVNTSNAHHDTEKKKKRRRNRDDCDDDDDNNFIGEVIGAFFFGNSNNRATDNDSESNNDIDYEIYSTDESNISYLNFPYADDQWGGVLLDPNQGNPMRIQSAVWYGTDFDNIDSWNTQLIFENQGPWGLDLQWSHLTEKLPGLPGDSLNLADVNLNYRWIQSPELIVRAGGGLNFLVDRFGTEVDYNLTLSADLFPARYWIARFELDHGEIGSAHQTHLMSSIGLNYKHLEIMTGYEYRKIGRVEIDGPILGIRFWW